MYHRYPMARRSNQLREPERPDLDPDKVREGSLLARMPRWVPDVRTLAGGAGRCPLGGDKR